MPIIVSYDQPGSGLRNRAYSAAQEYQNNSDELFLQGQSQNNQRLAQRDQLALQARNQASNDAFRQEELAQRGDEFDREQTLREQQSAATAPNTTFNDLDGNTYQGTLAQAVAVGNLKTTGVKGDDFQEGLRQVLGLPEPMVDYETPEGETIKVRRSQLPALQQKDAQLQSQMQRAQLADATKQQTMQDARDFHHQQLDVESQKLQAQMDHYADTDGSKAQALAIQGDMRISDARINRLKASIEAENKGYGQYVHGKPGGFVSDDDPRKSAHESHVKTLQDQLDSLYSERERTLESAYRLPPPSKSGPGTGTTSAPAPAGTQPAASPAKKPIDRDTAKQYMQKANGDPALAQRMAEADGWSF